MRAFFAPNLNVPPELKFQYLSPPHWVYIAGWFVITLLLCLLMPRFSRQAKDRCFKILMFLIIASECARIIWGVYHGLFTWQDWLPFHLCSTIIFTAPVIAYTRNEKLKQLLIAFTYGVSMPAAFFALLTPDKPVYTAFCFEFMQTMITHGAIVCMGIYLLVVIGYRPRVRVLPKLLGILLCWLAVCFAVNHLINAVDPQEIPRVANYMFLTFAPRDTLLETFESFAGRFYMVPVVVLLMLMWVLLFIPWEIIERRKENAKVNR